MNTYSRKDEAANSPVDIDNLESTFGKKLSPSFRDHYLKYNGGIPGRTYWLGGAFDEPLGLPPSSPWD
ncbi:MULTISPECIES: SMI1/KNR4 family protein [Pseudomonas]|uniref:SMI1/KNR4 family protein n=1 Tax=Pseudomonas TaxID=286 RepID=UPI002FF4E080